MSIRLHRRQLLTGAAGGAASFLLLPSRRAASAYRANERLNLAVVGVAGYAAATVFMPAVHRYDNVGISALCDVDQRKVEPALWQWKKFAELWPSSPKEEERQGAATYQRLVDDPPPLFEDFRRLFDEMAAGIDAVVVATPDHTHSLISAAALRAGKPVMSEKPLSISVHEARALRLLAAEQRLATTVNTQGAASPGFRRGLEILDEGLLGEVTEVHVFFSRGGQNFQSPPQGVHEAPKELNWNLWLAQVAYRAYHPGWINRIAWRDTSIGELGNFFPHSGNLAFMGLKVRALWDRPAEQSAHEPIRVTAECSEVNRLSYPRWERIRWEVPARGKLPPVTFTWHHGPAPDYAPGSRAKLVALLKDHGADDAEIEELLPYAGAILVGSRGLLVTGSHNTSVKLFPVERFAGVEQARPQTIASSPGHPQEWLAACRGGPMPLTRFEHAGPYHEFINLGDLATYFAGDVLEYDPVAFQIAGHAEANAALSYPYREGWRL